MLDVNRDIIDSSSGGMIAEYICSLVEREIELKKKVEIIQKEVISRQIAKLSNEAYILDQQLSGSVNDNLVRRQEEIEGTLRQLKEKLLNIQTQWAIDAFQSLKQIESCNIYVFGLSSINFAVV